MALTQSHPTPGLELNSNIRIPISTKSAIVFGHWDADGHLATEQTRQYLAQRQIKVTTVVSHKTNNYRFWTRLPEFDLTSHELVVFVDIAFRFRHPGESLSRLLAVSDKEPHKQFIAIDHHPLTLPKIPRCNLLLMSVGDPFECCLGIPEPDIMNVAALCDGAPTNVCPTLLLKKRALGVKRAAADRNGLAGYGLLELVRERQWAFFEALAEEDSEMHQSARGFRRRASQPSPLLEYARNHVPLSKTI